MILQINNYDICIYKDQRMVFCPITVIYILNIFSEQKGVFHGNCST